jgi:hypothetical protein
VEWIKKTFHAWWHDVTMDRNERYLEGAINSSDLKNRFLDLMTTNKT